MIQTEVQRLTLLPQEALPLPRQDVGRKIIILNGRGELPGEKRIPARHAVVIDFSAQPSVT